MSERRFLLNVPRGFLWTAAVLALLYFVWLVLVGGRVVVIRRGTAPLDPVVWVWVGLGLFGILFVLGLFAMLPARSRGDEDVASDATTEAIPAAEPSYAPPPAPSAYARRRPTGDVEVRLAPEDYKGKRVVEVSIPPKSANRGGVYAKAYVPVDEGIVLRVEDLVADRRDVAA